VKCQPHDATLDRRLVRYFARFYDAFDLPVFPIALCSYASPRQHAVDRHQVRVRDYTVLDFRYQVVQLNQLYLIRRRYSLTPRAADPAGASGSWARVGAANCGVLAAIPTLGDSI
jgi:hypothetical protein